jgi:hypothetical protein
MVRRYFFFSAAEKLGVKVTGFSKSPLHFPRTQPLAVPQS